jgi:hypothetical protein
LKKEGKKMNIQLIEKAWKKHKETKDSQFIIYTNMLVGYGINGVDTREYKDGNFIYDYTQRRTHIISDFQITEVGVIFHYAYQPNKKDIEWINTDIYLPLESIAGIEIKER